MVMAVSLIFIFTCACNVIVYARSVDHFDASTKHDTYVFHAEQNLKEGMHIGTVNGETCHSAVNQTILYALVPFNVPFTINKTGAITTKTSLGQNIASIFKFEVHKYCMFQTKVIPVVVRVHDGHIPQFNQSYYYASVLVSASIGMTVIQVQAYEGLGRKDGVVNYRITYQEYPQWFRINIITGWITVAATLTKDFRPRRLTVQAFDASDPSLLNTCTVQITVI